LRNTRAFGKLGRSTMTSIDISVERVPLLAPAEARRERVPWGWIASLLLHGLALALILLLLKPNGQPGADLAHFVPITIVTSRGTSNAPRAGENAAPLKAPAPTVQHRQASARKPTQIGVAPKVTPKDEMDAKLESLSKLTQAQSGSLPAARNFAATEPGEGGTGEGEAGAYGVRDLVRLQVLRRWSLDLSMLGGRDFSIAIRVQLTRRGDVLNAAVMDQQRFRTDPIYREIALSAKHAVILSSPLTLPEGHYADSFELTLLLNPRETQQ
jgi:hypothetical protein